MQINTKALAGFVLSMAVSWISWVPAAFAQAKYPSHPIRFLVPFPSGGATDTIARTIGEKIVAQMGQPVVIDNRSGAGGRIAAELTAKAEPDGYTMLVSTAGPISISPALYKTLPYNVERELLPVTRVAEIINVMVVNPSSGVKNVKEFIDWAKKRSGDVRFGSSGTGQPDHLSGEFFQRMAGIAMMHVPYKGGGPALVDLVSGDLQVMFSTYVVAMPYVTSGKLRAIAVTTPQRQPLLADLPTIGETVPGFAVSNWTGIFVPAKTPAHVVDRLFVEFMKAIEVPDVRSRQNVAGIEPVGSPSRIDFANFIREDLRRWAGIVKAANISVE